MRFSTFQSVLALAAPILVRGAPLAKRTAAASDILVLQFASVLEQLETSFYTQALATFQESDFISAGYSDAQIPIQQFQAIELDESTHISILEETIIDQGGDVITTCQFDFSNVLVDVSTMVTVARVVENLGVSAYLGAAHLISDPVLLTAAASIMSVEARHQTVLNILSGESSITQAFDIAFSPSEVLAIASTFISGCDLGITANPTLTITNDVIEIGTSLTFSSTAITGSTDTFFCQMLVGGAPFSISLPFSQCVVPEGISGPVAIFITSDNQPLNNNIRDQATNSIVAGPAMGFVDSTSEALGSLVHSSSSSSGSVVASGSAAVSSVVTTATITPDQASAIIASAATTATVAVTASAASASASVSAATATAAANNASSDVVAPGGPNAYTGPNADGTINVNGWSS